jgi:hypothetical protein
MLRDRVVALALSSVVVGGFSFGTEAKSYRWNCVYTQQASPKGLTSERFSLEFAFDDITEKAVIIGNQGVSDVEVHRGPLSVTFMEKLNGGVVQTTTVTNDGQSVHSRHTVMGKQMVPSQYYGQAQFVDARLGRARWSAGPRRTRDSDGRVRRRGQPKDQIARRGNCLGLC